MQITANAQIPKAIADTAINTTYAIDIFFFSSLCFALAFQRRTFTDGHRSQVEGFSPLNRDCTFFVLDLVGFTIYPQVAAFGEFEIAFFVLGCTEHFRH